MVGNVWMNVIYIINCIIFIFSLFKFKMINLDLLRLLKSDEI